MVTNHLRAPYGVYFTKNLTILRSPYGARPAAGRIVRIFINILDIVRCPVKFRYNLKFHGARSAFGRVNEDKMTSAGHSMVPGRRLHTSDGHRTISYMQKSLLHLQRYFISKDQKHYYK